MDLSLSGIVRRFGPVTALAGVDLAVAEGELLTILGPSGSGKTTLLKVVAGSVKNVVQSKMAHVTPDTMTAEMHRKLSEPGSASKVKQDPEDANPSPS